ncbi:type II toxin-antitoxin system HicB family antitoxin [bacterium]|nr:type II toxin-antitoxin system HicB family antitoxin [bacterium]
MPHRCTLEYWIDDGWYVGRIREIPGLFSQGETISELKENIRDAYRMLVQENAPVYHPSGRVDEMEFEL